MNYSLEQIADIVQGKIVSGHGGQISNFATDSRRIYTPANCMFVAIKGPNHNGHEFIKELAGRGVRYFLTEEKNEIQNEENDLCVISVPNTLTAFQQLAKFHRESFSGTVIGITGSNGKTVVKEWLAQSISTMASVAKNPKSYNSQIGVPISLLQMDSGPDYHILEAGISMPGEMVKLESIISPQIGIFTNIGDAHQEHFDDQKSKAQEKAKLFRNSEIVFYCKDSKIIDETLSYEYAGKKKLISWALYGEADFNIRIESTPKGLTRLRGDYNGKKLTLDIRYSDNASIENIIQIWLFWTYRNWPNELLQKKVLELESIAMRLEQKEGLRNCTLINDYYNADLHSLSIALDLLINQLPQKKKTLILSDLLQTGLKEDQLIDRINLLLNGKSLHRIILVGPVFHANLSKFNFPAEAYLDTSTFLSDFPIASLNDEAILLKGARKFTFEKISTRLEKRLHNTIVEVNMNRLLENLNHFRSKLKSGTKIMAMVKAFSYGSGSHEIAKFLAHQRVDYLGVAFADEGVGLREARVRIPIMVMNPDISGFDLIIENRLEPVLYSFEVLEEFRKIVSKVSQRKYPVHINIDTGMHRLGFQPKQINDLTSFFRNQNELEIISIFSHFTSADIAEKDEFTRKQAFIFEDCAKKLRTGLGANFIRHISNTVAINRFPEYHFEMVRLGIGLYGIDGLEHEGLLPVICMKTTISQIHDLKKGETVGYRQSQEMKNDGRVAVVPVGYADGLDRRLGNGVGIFICNGSKVPTIGKICMDMCMLDITGIDAKTGNEVTIIGDGADVSKMANSLDTITYELLSRIPQRVRRVYLFD